MSPHCHPSMSFRPVSLSVLDASVSINLNIMSCLNVVKESLKNIVHGFLKVVVSSQSEQKESSQWCSSGGDHRWCLHVCERSAHQKRQSSRSRGVQHVSGHPRCDRGLSHQAHAWDQSEDQDRASLRSEPTINQSMEQTDALEEYLKEYCCRKIQLVNFLFQSQRIKFHFQESLGLFTKLLKMTFSCFYITLIESFWALFSIFLCLDF